MRKEKRLLNRESRFGPSRERCLPLNDTETLRKRGLVTASLSGDILTIEPNNGQNLNCQEFNTTAYLQQFSLLVNTFLIPAC